ncbi:Phosphatidylserine decarboxylase [Tenacibaculum sp. MAR_2009_124]|uniref:phosphatidylserine decarboxylase n=1 Tax=Tenacibaculum sp. MAR_2009_124 TaxID=1250059 RepID=UPI00089B97BA|nr:phosphatidylserine decarboxylase [Tenacibaculum sp. MAR_2009_124]SEC89066.1 Phosphatidylserine decarboxylase [Tenacibaculum sp. MAR_2009_124]
METLISQSTHEPVVASLQEILSEDPKMEAALIASLNIAVESAKKKLNADLYKAIDNVFQGNGWPTTTNHYLDYLDLYVRLIPNESNDPEYPNAWKSNGQQNGYNQKVYDLLCQSYWLIDQKIPGTNLTMQSFEKFANWLVDFANAWGTFLDTEESLTKESLLSFKHDSMYNFHLYADNERSWNTFNEFFYREFNHADPETGLSPLRPISDPENNENIVSPADCTYKQYYPIDDQGNVLESNGKHTRVSLKGTHSIGTIDELLQESEYASDFYGGTFIHYFLSPFDYHRFHTPVSGEVLEIIPVEGKVYLNVELQENGQWDAPDGAEDGYEFTQARGLVVMDAGPVVGKVAILPIGMCQVSGVDMYTELQGKEVVKGQEFGKFRFGGSDIIMLFQKPPSELYMFKNDPGHEPIHFQYGQTAVYWNK